MRRLRMLSLVAIGHIGFMLSPSAAIAQLATDTTTFTGTVPGTCAIGGDTSSTVTMAVNNGTLTGETGGMTITSNVLANVTISSLVATNNFTGSNSATPTATLTAIASNQSVTAAIGNDSNPIELINQNDLDNAVSVKIGMEVTDANAPGVYEYTVLLSCLAR